MKLFDTHCHLNLSPLSEKWRQYWQEAQEAGVQKALLVGADLENSRRAIEIAQAEGSGCLGAAIGLHPMVFLEENNSGQISLQNEEISRPQATALIEEYEAQIAQLSNFPKQNVWAIGETGLEYYHLHERPDFDIIRGIQMILFHKLIRLANDWQKTLVLHLRDEETQVYDEVLEMILGEQIQTKIILHCISGSADFVQKAVQNPAVYVSFAGNVTFKNAQNIRDLVSAVPKNRFLIETDAPFLAPEPKRGTFPCTPAMVAQTAQYLENNFQIELAQVYQNSHEVFNL